MRQAAEERGVAAQRRAWRSKGRGDTGTRERMERKEGIRNLGELGGGITGV